MTGLMLRGLPLILLSLAGLARAGGGDAPITYDVSFERGVEARQGERVLWRTPLQAAWNEVRVLGNVLLVPGYNQTIVLSRRDGRFLAQPAGFLVQPHVGGESLVFFSFQGNTGDAILTRLDRDWKPAEQRVNLWSLFPPDCEVRWGEGVWGGVVRLDKQLRVVFKGLAGRCEGTLNTDFQGNVDLTLRRVK